MKSKLLKVKPIENADGTQSTYESQYGTLYDFYVEFENGDAGKANAKSTEFKYKIGQELTYEKKVYPSKKPGGEDLVIISKIKPLDFQPTSSYNNPETNKSSAYSMATDLVVLLWEEHGDKVVIDSESTLDAAVNYFYGFLMDDANDKNIIISRFRALEKAIKLVKNDALVNDMDIDSSLTLGGMIVEIAKRQYDKAKAMENSN